MAIFNGSGSYRSSFLMLLCKLYYTYQWNKDKVENNSGPSQKSCANQSGKSIDKLIQKILCCDRKNQYDTGHVDRSTNVFGIIKAFDGDFMSKESEQKSNTLTNQFVAIKNSQKSITSSCVTNINEVVSHYFLRPLQEYNTIQLFMVLYTPHFCHCFI